MASDGPPQSEALNQRLSRILYRCLEDGGSTKAALYLVVPGMHEFQLVSHYGWPRVQPPPAHLGPGHPLLTLMKRERRGLFANDLAAYPELLPFCPSTLSPRCYVSNIYNAGEWVGLLIQRDPHKGDRYSKESHEAATLAICQEVAKAIDDCVLKPENTNHGVPAEAPEEVAALRVPAPATVAMVHLEERFIHGEGEAFEAFLTSLEEEPRFPYLEPKGVLDALEPPQADPDALLPEQQTFFWEAANLVCAMVPTGAIALYISDTTEIKPVLVYSRVPLARELKRQILDHFTSQVPLAPGQEFRILAKCEWADRDPQPGKFLTLLPVVLEEQFGEDDLLLLFRLEDRPFSIHEQDFIRQVSRMLGFYLQESRLHERYHQSFLSVSKRILASADSRIPTLRAQSVNTAELSTELARRLHLSSAEVEAVSISAILHDVGTLLLDRAILDKPSLTQEDLEKVQTHPILASTFLKDLHFPFDILRIIRHHHERWDGTGYPDSLQGEAIPLGSRIIHLVESYEVMTSGTAYKLPKAAPVALAELEQLAGLAFDPAMVPEFIQLLKERHL